MNSILLRTSHSPARYSSARNRLSPLLRRSTDDALNRGRMNARLRETSLPGASEDDAPPTPAIAANRWWDPHLVDRLQPPLTRFRD